MSKGEGLSKFEDSLGREGFTPRQEPEGAKSEPPRFSADSPFPAFRMIAAGSSPVEPELARPTPMMRILPVVVIVAVLLLGIVWWMR